MDELDRLRAENAHLASRMAQAKRVFNAIVVALKEEGLSLEVVQHGHVFESYTRPTEVIAGPPIARISRRPD